MQSINNSLIFQSLTQSRRDFIPLGNFGGLPWQAAMAGRGHREKIRCERSAEQKLFCGIAMESQDPCLSIGVEFTWQRD